MENLKRLRFNKNKKKRYKLLDNDKSKIIVKKKNYLALKKT